MSLYVRSSVSGGVVCRHHDDDFELVRHGFLLPHCPGLRVLQRDWYKARQMGTGDQREHHQRNPDIGNRPAQRKAVLA